MFTEISFNRYQLLGKLIGSIVFIAILTLFIIVSIYPRGDQSRWLAPSAAIMFLLFTLVFLLQIFFLPIGVSIDDVSKKMEIKFLLLKSKNVSIADIDSYNSTIIVTKSESYEGMLLHLKSGKIILLSNFNLKDFSPIELFLNESGIKSLGKEKFRFISYYRQWFK
jgi:hypothetical protein